MILYTKAVQIVAPLKYFDNFWRTLEIPLIDCEISLILTWSANFVTYNAAASKDATFAVTDTKLYVPDVTSSIDDNAKLSQQLKSGFKRTINWNKYEPKATTQNSPNQYFDFLIEPSFQGVNRLFVLTFNANDSRIGHSRYFLSTEKIEDYNVMIDGRKFFDQTTKNDIRTYENIRKSATGQEDDYRTGCLLDYNYFKKHYKMIAIDLSKQQALDVNPKATQQINFIGNRSCNNNRLIFFTIEDAKETILDFSQGTVKVL